MLLTLLINPLFAALVGSLPEVMKPAMIVVQGDRLYVSEGCNFFIYSLDDLKLLKKFGKKGEGPGELLELPFFPNKITVLEDQLFVTGIGKAIAFSKEGKFINEFRTHQLVFQMFPVGKNFVAKEMGPAADKKSRDLVVTIYNPEMKKIKELYRQRWVSQGQPPRMEVDMILDFASVAIADDKIFVEKSPEGFIISVYDSNGNPLYEIKKEYEKREVTSADKEKAEKKLQEDPSVKNDLKDIGGWKEFKRMSTFNYPDYFPPIKDIEISGDRLYVMTFNEKNGKDEYIVMDLKGKVIKKIFIPGFLEGSVLGQISGSKLYSISKGNLYYLLENEDDEEWELYVEPLK
jgi:hypothetical protein